MEPSHRRGIAGTVLVHKVAGAAAAAGLALDDVVAEASARRRRGLERWASRLAPAPSRRSRQAWLLLDDGEMELGASAFMASRGCGACGWRRPISVGGHYRRDQLLAQTHLPDRRVALLVNGTGGTPPMELSIVARHALAVLRARGFGVGRAWCGNFMTALEMPGCSLSILAVDDARLRRLDAPATAPAWPGNGRIGERRTIVPVVTDSVRHAPVATETSPIGAAVHRAALAVADAFERAEAELTELDSKVGDGDLGISMVRGAAAIRALPEEAWREPEGALAAMAQALRRSIAGSSGPFYATALLRASRALGSQRVTAESWARAFSGAVASIGELGGAKRGDQTMLDALEPASDAFTAALRQGIAMDVAWARAIAAAEEEPACHGHDASACRSCGVSGQPSGSERRMPARWPCWCGCARLERLYADKSLVRPTVKSTARSASLLGQNGASSGCWRMVTRRGAHVGRIGAAVASYVWAIGHAHAQ